MDLTNATVEELKRELKRRDPGDEFWNLLDTFHAYMCTNDHNTVCDYYNENMLLDKREQPAHKEWQAILTSYKDSYNWTTRSLKEAFQSTANIFEKYYRLTDQQKELFKDLFSKLA